MSDKRKRLLGDDEIAAILERESDREDEGGAIEESSDSVAVGEVSPATPSTSTGLTRPITWKRVHHREGNVYADYKKVKDFSGNPSVTGFGGLSPFECFEKFFPDDIYDLVIEETNRYAGQKLQSIGQLSNRSIFRKWKEITLKEFKAFLALEIAMGLVHKPTLRSYLGKTFWLIRTPGFSSILSRDRYELIRSFLHFCNSDDAEDNKDDRLFKIRKVLDKVEALYSKYYTSDKEICIDESMIKFKGRLFFKQYLPNKPSAKWGVKIWSLCDSRTGFLLRFQVYTGKEISKVAKEGLSTRVFKSLLEGFYDKGHVCYMDNFYSSVPLYEVVEVGNRCLWNNYKEQERFA